MIHSEILSLIVSENRNTSAELIMPDQAMALLVLAHGAGAGMNHPFMKRLSDELATNGIGTLRYNFLYMEQGRKIPDPPTLATLTVKAAVYEAKKRHPDLPIIAGGKSFGGRMTSQLVAKECPDFLKAIIFFGFPLHPVNQPAVERAAHLKDIKIPMLFLQGTQDALADLKLIGQVCTNLPTATLHTFEKADHSFKQGKKDLIPTLASSVAEWLKGILKP